MSFLNNIVCVQPLAEQFLDLASRAAVQLGLSLDCAQAAFALQISEHGWQLQQLGKGAPGPLRVDFVEGAMAHRRQFGGGAGQMLARAVGIQSGIRPYILDATAGLGRDAFVLADLGCKLQLLERNALVAWLLQDGLQRAADSAQTAEIAGRMQLQNGDAIKLMQNWQHEVPQVIYLDPMFPQREKSALVKKEMRLLQPLVGADDDAPGLFLAAWQLASHRVVVKRPRTAPLISEQQPSFQLSGKSCRYDIYARKSLKTG